MSFQVFQERLDVWKDCLAETAINLYDEIGTINEGGHLKFADDQIIEEMHLCYWTILNWYKRSNDYGVGDLINYDKVAALTCLTILMHRDLIFKDHSAFIFENNRDQIVYGLAIEFAKSFSEGLGIEKPNGDFSDKSRDLLLNFRSVALSLPKLNINRSTNNEKDSLILIKLNRGFVRSFCLNFELIRKLSVKNKFDSQKNENKQKFEDEVALSNIEDCLGYKSPYVISDEHKNFNVRK